MSDEEKQESQKTVVAFVAGLLIGGLLVWVFSGTPAQTPTDTSDTTPTTEVQTGNISEDEEASEDITVDNAAAVVTATPTPASEMEVGEGSITVNNQPAGNSVTLDTATFPTTDGWVAVRSYPNGQLGSILGAARYSKEQGLIPESVELLVPTSAGRTYAVVFFTEDGDREFNLANDVQIDGILTTFTAQ